MKFIKYLSNLAIPGVILIIIIYGVIEKKDIFNSFLKGTEGGIKVVIKIFPTLLGLFLAIGVLKQSGLVDFLIELIYPFIGFLGIPREIMPLAILRPISRKRIYCNWYKYNEIVWSR